MTTLSPMKPTTQYFVMSPRTSLDSPPSRDALEQDENAAPNVTNGLGKGAARTTKTTKTPGVRAAAPASENKAAQAPPNSAPQVSPNTSRRSVQRQPLSARSRSDQVLPCMRPPTPTKTRKGPEASSPTPGRLGRGTPSQIQETPELSVNGCEELGENMSFANTSVYSEASHMNTSVYSCSSRLDQLSRRSCTKRTMSTQERIEQELEEKKRAMSRLRKQNDENVRKIREPDSSSTSCRKSTQVTIPKEFTLSQPSPRLKHSRSTTSDREDSVGSVRSARGPRWDQASAGPAPCSKWRPKLTVPKGPTCADPDAVERRRSVSCPPEDLDADDNAEPSVKGARSGVPVRASTPESRPQRVRPSTPTERRGQQSRASTPEQRAQPTRTATPERRSQPTRTATPEQRRAQAVSGNVAKQRGAEDEQARAQRARQLAIQKNQEQAKKNEKHCIFRRSQPAASAREEAAPARAATRASSREVSASVGSGVEPRRGDSVKATQRRPSFGSSTARPCLR